MTCTRELSTNLIHNGEGGQLIFFNTIIEKCERHYEKFGKSIKQSDVTQQRLELQV